MQAARFTSDDRRCAEARALEAAAHARSVRADIGLVQEMCESDPRVLGRGRAAVAALAAEAESIIARFEELSERFQRVASEMRARGHCTPADLACVDETAAALAGLSAEAARLRLRIQGPRLRVVARTEPVDGAVVDGTLAVQGP